MGDAALALEQGDFAWFRQFIYCQAGIRLSDAKRDMVAARLVRRVRHLGLHDLAEYARYLRASDPHGIERREFINSLTTNKTDFFREPHHFEFLRGEVFPAIRARAAAGGPRRLWIWSAGCSTGEEPYSLAMTVRDHFGPPTGWDIRIVASDIDTRVLATAQRGVYSDEQLAPVAVANRRRHFLRGRGEQAGRWMVRPELRSLVHFRRINLNEPADLPPGPLDVVFCRNVIIYFDRPTQQQLFGRVAGLLASDGYLFLGHSESLIGVTDRFVRVEETVHRLRAQGPTGAPAGPAPTPLPRLTARRIIVGQVFASAEPGLVGTVLGSCVSACLFDPAAGVGGMNHFLLPESPEAVGRASRYGVHAMELLINEILKLGGERRRLAAKVFGGAQVLASSSGSVSRQNIRFVREFLAVEKIPILAERLGGNRPIEVWFHTASGRAKVRYLRESLPAMLTRERVARAQIANQIDQETDSDVTLF